MLHSKEPPSTPPPVAEQRPIESAKKTGSARIVPPKESPQKKKDEEVTKKEVEKEAKKKKDVEVASPNKRGGKKGGGGGGGGGGNNNNAKPKGGEAISSPGNSRITTASDSKEEPWYTFAFSSNATFLRSANAGEASLDMCVAGVCWDGSTTNRAGARHGPSAIRTASHMLCDGMHPVFDISPLDFHFGDAGDLLLANTSIERMRASLVAPAQSLLERHSQVVWLGGDHSITLPLLRLVKERWGKPLAVLHFDAHCDTWSDHFGEPSGHGTWVREAFAEGLVVKECFTQIGIRSSADKKTREFVTAHGGQIFTARQLRGLENASQLKGLLDSVRARHKKYGEPPVYCTLDIDCLDPAFAPGTGTPEPGGLTTSQVLTILEELVPTLPFVGMDCVEVSPPYDHAEITSQAAAHFVWTYMCAQLAKKKKKPNVH